MTLVEDLRDRVRRDLAPHLDGFESYALIDYPRHSNVGDSAIWLGARAALRDAGLRPVYECDYWSYRPDALARSGGNTLIVISGGGNLGDLYAKHQQLREAVLERFPERPVLQLPQSVNFRDPAARDRARRIFDGHRRLTLLLRDAASLELAREWFAAPSALTPDVAFALTGRLVRDPPRDDVVWLLRQDRESTLDRSDTPGRVVDWRAADVAGPALTAADRLVRAATAWPGRSTPLRRGAFDLRARTLLQRGVAILSSADVVVTDRLHGHVLCLLLGIPHVLIDDRHSKIAAFRSTWTATSPLVVTAGDVAEARDRVGELVTRVRAAV